MPRWVLLMLLLLVLVLVGRVVEPHHLSLHHLLVYPLASTPPLINASENKRKCITNNLMSNE